MFRAFLGYTRQEVDDMTIQEFIDSTIILDDVLKIWHAPYLDHDQ